MQKFQNTNMTNTKGQNILDALNCFKKLLSKYHSNKFVGARNSIEQALG